MVKKVGPWRKELYKGCWSIKFPSRGSLCRWQRQQHSFAQPGWPGTALPWRTEFQGLFIAETQSTFQQGEFPCPCRLSCEGFWAEHCSPSPWRDGPWLCSSAWFTSPSCSWPASDKHPRLHPKPTAPNHQILYLPSQKRYLIMQISPPLQSPPQAMPGANQQLIWAVSELQCWQHLQILATGSFEQFLLCLHRPPDPLTLKDWNRHTRAWCAND